MSHDFESDDFDPAAALAAVAVTLPCDEAQPLNSLAEYECSVKQKTTTTTVERREKPRLSEKKKVALRAAQSSNYFNSYRPKRKVKNILTIMEEIEGPLARLRRCMKDRTAIKVWTRGAKEMRGVCHGYLQAFDRHWNLVLLDVDETYVFPKKAKSVPEAKEESSANVRGVDPEESSREKASDAAAGESRRPADGKTTSKNRVDLRWRHARQIFIRGDNVAFVSIVNL